MLLSFNWTKELFLFFLVATHSSRAPASGSQTGDTLGKALASVRSRLSSSGQL